MASLHIQLLMRIGGDSTGEPLRKGACSKPRSVHTFVIETWRHHAGQVEGEQLARNTGVEGLKSDSTVNRLSTNNKVSSSGRIYHLHKAESTLSGRDQALGVARSMVQPGSRLEMWKGL